MKGTVVRLIKVREQRISGYQTMALVPNFALNLASIICNTVHYYILINSSKE